MRNLKMKIDKHYNKLEEDDSEVQVNRSVSELDKSFSKKKTGSVDVSLH